MSEPLISVNDGSLSIQTRIGIGATALFTLAGVAAPLVSWWVSAPILFFCALVAGWGFWPLISSRLALRLSLNDAGRIAYETAEHLGIDGLDRPPDDKLNHFMLWLVSDERVRMYGVKPPSSRTNPITLADRDGLYPNARNELTTDFGAVVYRDMKVNRWDFWRFQRGLHKQAAKFHS